MVTFKKVTTKWREAPGVSGVSPLREKVWQEINLVSNFYVYMEVLKLDLERIIRK